ncbi:hypothetical protein GCM10027405_30470 [Arthrobacter alkaliphilus]
MIITHFYRKSSRSAFGHIWILRRENTAPPQGCDSPMIVDAVLTLYLSDGNGARFINEGELRTVGQVGIKIL